jgi:hypothetical protein
MDATQEINFYNNFDLIANTLKGHDPQVVKSLSEIAIYVAGLHIELREIKFNNKKLRIESYEKDNEIEKLTIDLQAEQYMNQI